MEAIGEKLRSAREQLGKSVEEIARETNITKRYIIALEEEDFTVFPGEPYLIGFLRTYSESLGLPPDELVALYKNFKIQEQPLPMDELIQKPHRRPFWIIPVVIIILGGLGTGGYFLWPLLKARSEERQIVKEAEAAAEEAVTGTVYEMKNEMIERRFEEGDVVKISLGDQEFSVLLESVGDRLKIKTDEYDLELSVGEEVVLDLNDDRQDDVKLYVQDIDIDNEQKAAVVRFDRFTQAAIVAERTEQREEETDIFNGEPDSLTDEAGTAGIDETVPVIGDTAVYTRRTEPVVITERENREPLSMDIVFRGYCLLRYLIDDDQREERYFHKGETFRLEANNQIRLWISNAGAVKARIAGSDVDMGDPGEVVTNLVRWEQDEQSDLWKLILVPVY